MTTVSSGPLSLRRRRELAVVLVVGLIHIGGTIAASRHQTPHRHFDLLGFVLLAVAPLVLPARLRWPRATLLVVLASTLAYSSAGYPKGPIFVPLIVAFIWVLLCGYRITAVVAMVAGYTGFSWLGAALGTDEPPTWVGAVGLAAWLFTLFSVGEAVRSRRERSLAARQTEEEAQRRRIADERLRIAQDLHDSVAHSMSLINIQAGVALHLIDERPEQVRAALATIKQASKDALVELRSIVGMLRHDGEEAPLAPAPSLQQVDELVAGAEAAGLRVHVEKHGDLAAVPRNVDTAAFRIIQESLTNVIRHAHDADTFVRIAATEGNLHLDIVDEGPPHAPPFDLPAGGNGLAGMRERAASVGGELHAGRRLGRGFAVHARLPLGDER